MSSPAICFDATGTLIEVRESVGAVYQRIARTYGVELPAWRLDDAFHRVLRHAPARGLEGDTLAARRANEIEWWFERIRQTIQATDSTARFDDFRAFAGTLFEAYRAASAWRPRAGVLETLAALEAQNCSMAVVSNFDHRLLDILEGLDLSRFFKVIVIPSECGAAKPQRRLFEIVAETLETPVDRLFYVGDDDPSVLDAITALGLRVFDLRRLSSLAALPDLAARAATLHTTPHATRHITLSEPLERRRPS